MERDQCLLSLRRFNIVNLLPVQSPSQSWWLFFLGEIDKWILKFMELQGIPDSQNDFEKEQNERFILSDFRTYYKVNSTQNRSIRAYTYISRMELKVQRENGLAAYCSEALYEDVLSPCCQNYSNLPLLWPYSLSLFFKFIFWVSNKSHYLKIKI